MFALKFILNMLPQAFYIFLLRTILSLVSFDSTLGAVNAAAHFAFYSLFTIKNTTHIGPDFRLFAKTYKCNIAAFQRMTKILFIFNIRK